MKKQLLLTRMLLLVALLVGSVSAWGVDADVTYDVANGTVSNGTLIASGASFPGEGSDNFKMNTGYFILGKSGAYINFPIYSSNVSKIVVTGRSGASSSTKMNIFVGTTAVSTETTGSTGTNTYNIASGYQTAGTQYTLKVTSNHNAQITKIEIFYATGGGTETVATPTFSPAAGTYNKAQSVSISCATNDATIRYTTDGNDPTESSDIYSSPISVTTTGTTIKAKAFKTEMDPSSVASATYTIKPNQPTISATGATITITGDDGCTFYYTTNGDAPDNTKTQYTTPFDLNEDCTIKAKAYDSYGNASDAKSLSFKYMPLAPKNINSNYYVKVTDASTLENGDAILIVNEEEKKALGPQSGNNCPEKSVDISNGVISDKGEALKLILVKKTEKVNDVDTEVFYFYTGTGYLYAASNSSNYLKEQNPATTNARATISMSSDNAVITFRGSYTHNLVRYNSDSSLFSCYSSGQNPVQIYKEVVPPTVSGTITEAGWNTFSSNYALDLSTISGGAAYVATTNDNTEVTLTETSAKVAAGTGLMIKGTAGETFTIGVTSDAATLTRDNLLVGLPNGGKVAKDDYNYVFAWTTGSVSTAGFWYVNDAEPTLGAGKAYLHSVGSNGAKLSIVIDDTPSQEETDGIKSVQGSRFTVNGEAYNLAGQKVGADYKGIVIVNGKKIVRK